MRKFVVGVGTVLALGGGGGYYWHQHQPSLSTIEQHSHAVREAAQALRNSSLGLFKPPAPGADLDVVSLGIESSADRIYTIAALWLDDGAHKYAHEHADAGRERDRAQMLDALTEIHQELSHIVSNDVMITTAAHQLDDATAVLSADLGVPVVAP